MTQEEYTQHIEDINRLNHKDMARIYRFAPSGHPYFDKTNGLYLVFYKRFEKLGGMTSEISKQLGWGH